jgi:cytidylate kinase
VLRSLFVNRRSSFYLIPMPSDASAAPDPATLRDVVAIDGPSGAGKSTVARSLAGRLGWAYLDTGAMYRAVTWYLLENQLEQLLEPSSGAPFDVTGVQSLLECMALELLPSGQVLVNGRDVTTHIRSREVESRVSVVSALAPVRARMRALQRRLAAQMPLVAEGRDMGSVVFPQARWKFFLDAEPEERARRRARDFVAQGRAVTEADVLEEIAVRDRLDSTRHDAPLTRSADAVYVDTTGLTIEQVVEALARLVRGGGQRWRP